MVGVCSVRSASHPPSPWRPEGGSQTRPPCSGRGQARTIQTCAEILPLEAEESRHSRARTTTPVGGRHGGHVGARRTCKSGASVWDVLCGSRRRRGLSMTSRHPTLARPPRGHEPIREATAPASSRTTTVWGADMHRQSGLPDDGCLSRETNWSASTRRWTPTSSNTSHQRLYRAPWRGRVQPGS